MITLSDKERREEKKAKFMNALRMMRAQGMSTKDIAKRLGKNYMTVHRWLRGDFDIDKLPTRSYESVMGDAPFLGISERIRGGDAVSGEDDGGAERGYIPVFTGRPSDLARFFDDLGLPKPGVEPHEQIECPPELLNERWLYGITIYESDLSMMPVLRPGWTVIVKPSGQPRDGNFVVARLETTPREVVVREFGRREGKIVLKAYNPAYGELVLDPSAVGWIKPVSHIRLPE